MSSPVFPSLDDIYCTSADCDGVHVAGIIKLTDDMKTAKRFNAVGLWSVNRETNCGTWTSASG